MVTLALAGLRARGSRTLLSALGILAASLVVGTGVTVGFGLATGFERSADSAGLPDVIARFDGERRETVDERVRALPNLAAASYRYERLNAELLAKGHFTHRGAVNTVSAGRRGYEITDGRDVSNERPGEVVVERGLAKAWDLHPGDTLVVGHRTGELRIVGIATSPDNVAYPLATTARVYLAEATIRERLGFVPDDANVALLWLNDPSKADVTLTQARAVSFGLGKLQFVTREGVRVLLSQAAGIVISLLVAFSLVALVAAGTMLAAGAHAEVQRRLSAFGVQRALGFTPARIASLQAAEATLVAVPAALLGIAVGSLAVAGPSAGLLAALNEQPPGRDLLGPLALAFLAVLAIVVAAAQDLRRRAARGAPRGPRRGRDDDRQHGEERERQRQHERAAGRALVERGQQLAGAPRDRERPDRQPRERRRHGHDRRLGGLQRRDPPRREAERALHAERAQAPLDVGVRARGEHRPGGDERDQRERDEQ